MTVKLEMIIRDRELYTDNGVLVPPTYATTGSGAVDLRSAVDACLRPGETVMVDSGVSVHIGSANNPFEGMGLAAIIAPRSGLGTKKGLILGNTVGFIDEDYQGPLLICVYNRGQVVQNISRGERIAQMWFQMVMRPTFLIVDEFSESTDRGDNGFGSTGRR